MLDAAAGLVYATGACVGRAAGGTTAFLGGLGLYFEIARLGAGGGGGEEEELYEDTDKFDE